MGYILDLRKELGSRPVIMAGAGVILLNEKNEILLGRRTDNDYWDYPAGSMEIGESFEECARREVLEETGLAVGRLALIGVYSGPDSLCRAANGDEWYVVNTSFFAEDWSGEPRVNDAESVRLKWVRPEDMPETLVRSHREILRDYLKMQKNE